MSTPPKLHSEYYGTFTFTYDVDPWTPSRASPEIGYWLKLQTVSAWFGDSYSGDDWHEQCCSHRRCADNSDDNHSVVQHRRSSRLHSTENFTCIWNVRNNSLSPDAQSTQRLLLIIRLVFRGCYGWCSTSVRNFGKCNFLLWTIVKSTMLQKYLLIC